MQLWRNSLQHREVPRMDLPNWLGAGALRVDEAGTRADFSDDGAQANCIARYSID